MKLKDGIVQNEIDGVFYLGDSGIREKRFNGMIKLNQTGAFVTKMLMNETDEEQIVQAMCEKYQVSTDEVSSDVHLLINALRENGLIQND